MLDALLEAGFDAVYDDPSYDLLKEIYDGPKWANDLDAFITKVRAFTARCATPRTTTKSASPIRRNGAASA